MKTDSKLLINEYPLLVLPSLAIKIGLNEAIILQQIHYWMDINRRKKEAVMVDGRYWMYNSYEDWHKQFQFWGLNTIKRAITHLEDLGILISRQLMLNPYDHTKYYSIDYDQLDRLLNDGLTQGGSIDRPKMGQSEDPKWVNLIESEINTETNTKTVTENEIKIMEPVEDNLDPRLYRALSNSFTRDTGILLYRNAEWDQAITDMIINGVDPGLMGQAIRQLHEKKMTVSGPWSIVKTAIGMKMGSVATFQVENG